MRKNSFCILLFMLVGFTVYPLASYGQVTIGSDAVPLQGSLLQLKETEDATNNAHRGLGMPRVNLTNARALYPMFLKADGVSETDAYNTSALKNSENQKHTGLVVYNVNKCLLNGVGLYVWSGDEWQSLNQDVTSLEGMAEKLGTVQGVASTEAVSKGVAWHRDHESNIFFSMNFDATNLAGSNNRWMTTNLATKTYDVRTTNTDWGIDGKPNLTDSYVNTGTEIIPYKTAFWGYPNPDETTIISHVSTTYDARPHLGLLYNYAAATGNQNPSIVNQGHMEVTLPDEIANNKGVQGICPTDWHIPTDKEWTELENEIKANAPVYSGSEVNTNELTYAMVDMCEGNTKKFYSNFVLNRGFSVLLTGWGGLYGSNELSGQATIHWSSSSFSKGYAYTRYFHSSVSYVIGNFYDRNYLFSVRCKKDN